MNVDCISRPGIPFLTSVVDVKVLEFSSLTDALRELGRSHAVRMLSGGFATGVRSCACTMLFRSLILTCKISLKTSRQKARSCVWTVAANPVCVGMRRFSVGLDLLHVSSNWLLQGVA